MTMMTQKGATVEAAIDAALQTLDVSRDKVKVEVLDQGRKGFFGIGSKEAEVKITVIEKAKPIRTNENEADCKRNKKWKFSSKMKLLKY